MNKDRGNLFANSLLLLRGILFIIIGLFIAIPSAQILSNIAIASSWPQVTGRVISSAVESRWASRIHDLGQGYCERILYRYSVNGNNYISDDVRFYQTWTKSSREVEKVVAGYPAGQEVSVYYKPANPQIAVLDPISVSSMECSCLGIGILLILIGAGTAINTLIKGFWE